MGGRAGREYGVCQPVRKVAAERFRHRDVRDESLPKEGAGAPVRVVVDLVGDDDVAGGVVFAQGAAGIDADDALDAEGFERVNVGAIVDLAGADLVSQPVPRQEGDFLFLQCANHDGRAGSAKGSVEIVFFCFGQAGHGVEAGASDDSQCCGYRHGSSPMLWVCGMPFRTTPDEVIGARWARGLLPRRC